MEAHPARVGLRWRLKRWGLTCCCSQGMHELRQFESHHHTAISSKGHIWHYNSHPVVGTSVAVPAESLGSVLQGIFDELREQEQEIADREKTISNLQVLLLLGHTPCPASAGRRAPHALCPHWPLGSKNRL